MRKVREKMVSGEGGRERGEKERERMKEGRVRERGSEREVEKEREKGEIAGGRETRVRWKIGRGRKREKCEGHVI